MYLMGEDFIIAPKPAAILIESVLNTQLMSF